MKCSNCGMETHGGYCDCMIVDGEFKGAWWNEKTELLEVDPYISTNGELEGEGEDDLDISLEEGKS